MHTRTDIKRIVDFFIYSASKIAQGSRERMCSDILYYHFTAQPILCPTKQGKWREKITFELLQNFVKVFKRDPRSYEENVIISDELSFSLFKHIIHTALDYCTDIFQRFISVEIGRHFLIHNDNDRRIK